MKQSSYNNQISWLFLNFTASTFICKTIVVWQLDSELLNVSQGRLCVSGKIFEKLILILLVPIALS